MVRQHSHRPTPVLDKSNPSWAGTPFLRTQQRVAITRYEQRRPNAQMIPPGPGALGEKKKLCVMSPTPVCVPDPGKTFRWLISGTIVREIKFQSLSSETGMTG